MRKPKISVQALVERKLEGYIITPSQRKKRKEVIAQILADLLVHGKAVFPPHPAMPGEPILMELNPREWLSLVETVQEWLTRKTYFDNLVDAQGNRYILLQDVSHGSFDLSDNGSKEVES